MARHHPRNCDRVLPFHFDTIGRFTHGCLKSVRSLAISQIYTPLMPRCRPRLSVSLRTLFVLLTIIGGWLGYQLNWIRQRRELLQDRCYRANHANYNVPPPPGGYVNASPPSTLGLVGEQGYAMIWRLWTGPIPDAQERRRVEKLLPEAEFVWPKPSAPPL